MARIFDNTYDTGLLNLAQKENARADVLRGNIGDRLRQMAEDQYKWQQRDKAAKEAQALQDFRKFAADPGEQAYDSTNLFATNKKLADEAAKREAEIKAGTRQPLTGPDDSRLFSKKEMEDLNRVYGRSEVQSKMDPVALTNLVKEEGFRLGIDPKEIAAAQTLLTPAKTEPSYAMKKAIDTRAKMLQDQYKDSLDGSGSSSSSGKKGSYDKTSMLDVEKAAKEANISPWLTRFISTYDEDQLIDSVRRARGLGYSTKDALLAAKNSIDRGTFGDTFNKEWFAEELGRFNKQGSRKAGPVPTIAEILGRQGTTDESAMLQKAIAEEAPWLFRNATSTAPTTAVPTKTTELQTNARTDGVTRYASTKNGKYLDGTKVTDAIATRVADIKALQDDGYLADQELVLINPADGETRTYNKGEVPENLQASIISPDDYIRRYGTVSSDTTSTDTATPESDGDLVSLLSKTPTIGVPPASDATIKQMEAQDKGLIDSSLTIIPGALVTKGAIKATSGLVKDIATRGIGALRNKAISLGDARRLKKMIEEAAATTKNTKEINRLRDAHQALMDQLRRGRYQ